MTFWSSQKIELNLDRLTDYPDAEMVDCNALTLRVGREIYITPGLEHAAPRSHTKTLLDFGQPFALPPGQFALILTEETITIPLDAMGFISIRAGYKLKGLVNISGFHVDPGWNGPLVFTILNSGPATIHLQRGLPIFLLWVACLEEVSVKRKSTPGERGIPPSLLGNITGVVDSIYAVEHRISEQVGAVAEKHEEFRTQLAEIKERQNKVLLYFAVAAIFASAVVGVGVKMAAEYLFPVNHASQQQTEP